MGNWREKWKGDRLGVGDLFYPNIPTISIISTNLQMIARVFGAIVNEVDYRGRVIAQGGVKSLLHMCVNNSEKGCDLASQALAKIGITSDPRLAFSGQRCMEVCVHIIS